MEASNRCKNAISAIETRPTIESYLSLEVTKSLEKQQLDRVKELKYGTPIKNKKLLAKDAACVTIINQYRSGTININEYMQKVILLMKTRWKLKSIIIYIKI